MQLVAMRRAEIVDEGLVVEADGVDHQRVAFVVADGLAIPGWLHMGRMRHIQIDPPHIVVVLMQHPDLLGGLDEEQRLRRRQDEARNAGCPAARRARPHRLAGQHLLVGLLQRVFGKLRQIRIADVGNPKRRLPADIIGHITMGRVLLHRLRTAWHGGPFGADCNPSDIDGGQIWRASLRQRSARACANKAGQQTGSKRTHSSKWHSSKWHGSNWHGSKWPGSKWHGSKWHGSKWHGWLHPGALLTACFCGLHVRQGRRTPATEARS